MPSRKRSRTPPAAPVPAPAAPAPVQAVAQPVPLRETFTRQQLLAAALVLVASVPAVLLPVWAGPAQVERGRRRRRRRSLLTLSALIFDHAQWLLESRRQMLLTIGVRRARRGDGAGGADRPARADALRRRCSSSSAAGARPRRSCSEPGVAYALLGVDPVKSYPYVLGMAWPAIGANVMRRIALAGTGHGPTTVLGRGRW